MPGPQRATSELRTNLVGDLIKENRFICCFEVLDRIEILESTYASNGLLRGSSISQYKG